MMTAMVRNVLGDNPAIIALVSNRVYVDELPIPSELPAITVHPASDVPDQDVSKGGVVRVQVSCWAEKGNPMNPAKVEAVAAAVKAVLHLPRLNNHVDRWTLDTEDLPEPVQYDIISRYVTGGIRLIDPNTGWYHKPVDVLITFNEV
jgi:hypothetical protein